MVGSNLFNLLGVLGITAGVVKGGMPVPAEAVSVDIPVMVAVSLGCLPVFFTGHQIARWEGILFLFYYFAYIGNIVLLAAGSPKAAALQFGLMWIAAPVTVLAFVLAYGFRRTATRDLLTATSESEATPEQQPENLE